MPPIKSTDALIAHLSAHRDLSFTKVMGIAFPVRLLPELANGSFVGCDFANGVVRGGDWTGAEFVDCRLSGITLSRAHLFGAQFVRCDLTGARFEDCDLSAAKLVDCTLAGAEFRRCDFEAAQVSGCDVTLDPTDEAIAA